jgi:hypothetical protein
MLLAPLLHLAIAFAPTPALPPAVIAAAIVEAGRLWAPYGVDVRPASPPEPAGTLAPDAVTLTVVAATPSAAERLRAPGALAAIEFDAGGLPRPRIAIYSRDVSDFIEHVRVLGASDAQWPRAMREGILGRAVGRVLAHEIGHFVLGTRGHAAHGLMRAEQAADDLVAPTRGGLGLAAADVARLRRRTGKRPAPVAGLSVTVDSAEGGPAAFSEPAPRT